MANGYIKLHRKMMEWGWYKDPNTLRVFLHLLLKANYAEAEFMGHKIKPGQVVIGRKALAEELEMTEQQIRTSLVHLKSTNEITIKSTNKFSVVTIVNWALYQCDNEKTTSKTTNKSTNEQPTTNHNIRNKERKNIGGTPKKGKAKELDEYYHMLEEWANDEE